MAKKDHKTLLIIDGYSLLYRAWHALPPLTTSSGEVVNAVYGFASILMKAIKDLKPSHVAVAFDLAAPTFRHEAYKEYKAQREKQPDEFYDQITRVRALLEAMGIPAYEKEGFEADDVIATLSRQLTAQNPDLSVIVLTGDMDALALVNDRITIASPKKGITDVVMFDPEMVGEKYAGMLPSDITLYKTLRGDPSDNIPGVKGVGEKTAMELARTYHTVDALLDGLPDNENVRPAIRQSILSQKDELYATLSLVLLRDDVVFEYDLEDMKFGTDIDGPALVHLFQELEFKTLLTRLKDIGISPTAKASSVDTQYICVADTESFDAFYSAVTGQTEIAIDTETTSIDPLTAELVGISVCWKEGVAYYLAWSSLTKQQQKKCIGVLENPDIKKIGHNIKYDMQVLDGVGITLGGLYWDTMIAAYLINPGVRAYGLDALSFSEFGHTKITIESLIGTKGDMTMDQVPLEQITQYACEDADYTWRLYTRLSTQLEEVSLTSLLTDIEMPLIAVLSEMEMNGVTLDTDFFATLSKSVHKNQDTVKTEIYRLAGHEFNIDSPTQLKTVLFEELELSPRNIKKGKTGLSTAASELEKLKGLHEIIDWILKYREVTKLLNTYIDVLPTLINKKTGRLHTNYNQTIAATGRLSSTNPNLQNIPIRTELGREIRKGFIAGKGTVLLTADYSQIELRVVASLANDTKMIQAFKEGIDIHTATAAEMNGVALDEVTKDMRRAAKAINFGVLYGMGPQGLAEGAGISFEEAQDFIERYYYAYPNVRNYMDEILQQARALGYVETMFGRRRYAPELKSGVMQVRRAAERAVINMPVQGSAADIMKKAMIAVANRIIEQKLDNDIAMLLQVHDELIFEVNPKKIAALSQMVREEMEHVVQLKVPLDVEISSGPNWGQLSSL